MKFTLHILSKESVLSWKKWTVVWNKTKLENIKIIETSFDEKKVC